MPGSEGLSGEYVELSPDSGQENFVPERTDAIRVFLVPWDEHIDFCSYLLGFTRITVGLVTPPALPVRELTRTLPDQHPRLRFMYATSARVKGRGEPQRSPADDSMAWDYAEITATYSYLPYRLLEDSEIYDDNDCTPDSEECCDAPELDRYIIRETTPQSQFLGLPSRSLAWVTDEPTGGFANLQAGAGLIVCSSLKELTWIQIPPTPDDLLNCPNSAQFDQATGTVNSCIFDGKAPGTVLFIGYAAKLRAPFIALGDVQVGHYWDITFKFLMRDSGPGLGGVNNGYDDGRAGHNYLYHHTRHKWDLVTDNHLKTGNRIYKQYDHNNLFFIST